MNDSIKDRIAGNLRYYRKKNRITQKALAEQLGVSHNAVSAWEKGNNFIDSDTLYHICKIFGVTANDMYGMSPSGTPSSTAICFDLDEYTKEELDSIKEFAAYVKSKRRKK